MTKIPRYDKSAYSGQGDRVPKEKWPKVNCDRNHEIKVVIFEGWCVGFRALPREQLVEDWEGAVREREKGGYIGRLGWNRLEDVDFVNEALRRYDPLTDQLDALIHMYVFSESIFLLLNRILTLFGGCVIYLGVSTL